MNRWMLALRLVVAVLMVMALRATSPSYFSLLRVIACLAAIEAMWLAINQQRRSWVLAFGFVAVLWNPVYPIRMQAQAWHVLDIGAATLFVLSVATLRAGPLIPTRIYASLGRFRWAVLVALLLFVTSAYVVTLQFRTKKMPPPQQVQQTPSEDPIITAVKQRRATKYESLITIRAGRIDRTEYSRLSPVRSKLLEIRLREASELGDRVAQQALRDIQQWRQALPRTATR